MTENRTSLARRVRRVVSCLLLTVALATPALSLAQQEATEPELPVLELTLGEAIEMALRHNLQVQIASYQPDLQEEAIMGSRAPFDPVFTASLPQSYQRQVTQGADELAGADVLSSNRLSGGFSFRQQLEWGTDWSLSWSSARSASNSAFSRFNPQFTAGLNLAVNQPLLEGFGRENNTAQIISARNNYRSSLESFRNSVQNTVFLTYDAYWQLVLAIRSLEVQREGHDLAAQQLERNRIQVEIGTLAPIETIQAERDVAARELSVTQGQLNVRDRMDTLKRLINVEAGTPHGWNVDIVPVDEPPTTFEPVDVANALAVAMDNDPDLRQLRITAETRALSVRTSRNALLPNLNFNGSINLTGQGGNRIISSGFGSDAVLEIQEGGYFDAVQALFSGDFRTWQVGLTLTLPINNWGDRAAHAQAVIQERQTLTQIADAEQQLRVDVISAARNVDSLVAQVAQARTASELAARQLDAEQRKFAVGSTTNFQVLTFQRQLSDAQTAELQATIQLALAIARLEQAKGTLLEFLGFRIGMAGVPSGSGSR